MTSLTPAAFTALPAAGLTAGCACTQAKARACAGNTAWLYEAYTAAPVPGATVRRVSDEYNHTGNGLGRPLALAATHERGLLRSLASPDRALSLTGDGNAAPVPMLVPAFRYGVPTDAQPYFGLACVTSVPLPMTPYLALLRTRLLARLTSGSTATLSLFLANDSEGLNLVARGASVSVASGTATLYELALNVPTAIRNGLPLFAGLLASVPGGVSLELNDSDESGAIFVLSSR